MPIRYHSTERDLPGGFGGNPDFREALFAGIAPDGGLFMPDRLPVFDAAAWDSFRGLSYPDLAARLLAPLVEGAISAPELAVLTRDAYGFDVPVERYDGDRWILRLDRGPTASFKDFAARLMARWMRALSPPGAPMTVLVATSGDTGSAVGHAFRDLPGVRVVLLYPEGQVSPVQKRQLDTLGGAVRAVEVAGSFDDCQRMAKEAFLDAALRPLRLISANSISIGRILPQMVYYAWAWARVAPPGGAVSFYVPSGNFGNALGCEFARRMGLPVARLTLAVNENDAFPRYLSTGTYAPVHPSRNCLSNAMNVGNPSNLARFAALYGGVLTRAGDFRREADRERWRRNTASVSISDAETEETMRRAWREHRVLLDPHGAVGIAALERLDDRSAPAVCLETAHPAKFPEVVERVLGFSPEPPPSLREIRTQEARFDRLRAEYGALCDYLRKLP